MIGCAGSVDAHGAIANMAPARRAFLAILRRSRVVARAVLRVAGDPERDPRQFYRWMSAGLGARDQAILLRPGVRERQVKGVSAACGRKGGTDALLDELAILASPWPFELRDVRVPVLLWHGTDDRSTPIHIARTIATALPRCEQRVYEGAGHLLVHDHWAEIFAALLAA
jgi:pimeloyl-ACP methyl ester carboxylesterase